MKTVRYFLVLCLLFTLPLHSACSENMIKFDSEEIRVDKVYFDKFVEYTDTNSLGITIMLLFSIVFVSFFITMIVEGVNPLDSLVMVSNAFTSNGYAILGSTSPGVLTSTFLVWSGYIISGVGTATLAAAIVHRNSKKKFQKLEDKIDNLEKILIQYQDTNTKDKDE